MKEYSLKHRLFQSQLGPWLRLMRFDRPIGLWLLLWPTLWGLVAAASGMPSPKNLGIFVLGVVVMRSAGCVINDYLDRDIDPLVIRTQQRPIASGEITPNSALGLFVGLMFLALGLVSFTNVLTIQLAMVGAVLASTYPLFKRFTHLPQAMLGLAFAWSIPMAFAAETDTLPAIVWLWVAINVVWVLIYDTQYAMADRPDDLKVGVKSTAILLGRFDLWVFALGMLVMVGLLIQLGLVMDAGLGWWLSVGVVMALFSQQAWRIRSRAPMDCFEAFLSNHWVGLVVFLGLLSDTVTIL